MMSADHSSETLLRRQTLREREQLLGYSDPVSVASPRKETHVSKAITLPRSLDLMQGSRLDRVGGTPLVVETKVRSQSILSMETQCCRQAK
jgi:hypothetical protein